MEKVKILERELQYIIERNRSIAFLQYLISHAIEYEQVNKQQ